MGSDEAEQRARDALRVTLRDKELPDRFLTGSEAPFMEGPVDWHRLVHAEVKPREIISAAMIPVLKLPNGRRIEQSFSLQKLERRWRSGWRSLLEGKCWRRLRPALSVPRHGEALVRAR